MWVKWSCHVQKAVLFLSSNLQPLALIIFDAHFCNVPRALEVGDVDAPFVAESFPDTYSLHSDEFCVSTLISTYFGALALCSFSKITVVYSSLGLWAPQSRICMPRCTVLSIYFLLSCMQVLIIVRLVTPKTFLPLLYLGHFMLLQSLLGSKGWVNCCCLSLTAADLVLLVLWQANQQKGGLLVRTNLISSRAMMKECLCLQW